MHPTIAQIKKKSTTRIGLPPTPPSSSSSSSPSLREHYQHLPNANVIRIMRQILPPHAKISDEAKDAMQECVSEFISFITEEANARCRVEQRKIITADDLIWALGQLGFDDYVGPLSAFLQKNRDMNGIGPRLSKGYMGSIPRRSSTGPYVLQGIGPSHGPFVEGAGTSANFGLMPTTTVVDAASCSEDETGFYDPLAYLK